MTTFHRNLRRATLVALLVALCIPSSSSAHDVTPGWTTFRGATYQACDIAGVWPGDSSSVQCRTVYGTATAWRWDGARWHGTKLEGRTRVYAYPWTREWSWVWTSNTGWLAMQHEYLHG